MSVSNIRTVIDRIKVASPESPIAVFFERTNSGTQLNAMFYNSINTRRRIEIDEKRLIGVFDRRDTERAKDLLREALANHGIYSRQPIKEARIW